MRFLIGFGLIILGGVTSALFPNAISFITMFAGVFLFISFTDEEIFTDYVIANSNKLMVRKRYYLLIFLFQYVISIFTLGFVKVKTRIIWKEEYYICSPEQFEKDFEKTRISRKEYISLRNEQRRIYSTEDLSLEFMDGAYSPEDFDYKKKKTAIY